MKLETVGAVRVATVTLTEREIELLAAMSKQTMDAPGATEDELAELYSNLCDVLKSTRQAEAV